MPDQSIEDKIEEPIQATNTVTLWRAEVNLKFAQWLANIKNSYFFSPNSTYTELEIAYYNL